MASSWAEENDKKINYTKLCRLLYDGGSAAVRTVFDGKCPPASLATSLKKYKPNLLNLKKPKGKVLSEDQWDKLYPSSGTIPNSEDFDITLLFVLLRNICGLTKPATGWDDLPTLTDTTPEANLVRIKHHRNNVVAHSSKAEVDDAQFETYWNDISAALVSLGLKQDDIDSMKSSVLGKENYNHLVECWSLSDEDIKLQLQKLVIEASETSSEIKKVKVDTAEMKKNASEIKTDTEQIKSNTVKIGEATSSLDASLKRIESNMQYQKAQAEEASEVDKLPYSDFTYMIQQKCRSYHQSSRLWILNQVELNVKERKPESSVTIIKAGPGMGKSVVAAKICEIYQDRKILGACHFFQYNNSLRNNPRLMLQSIARQLCYSVTNYQEALETKLKTSLVANVDISKLNCEELFVLLFEEPLSHLCHEHNVIIVIDALDECANQFKDEIRFVLERKLACLPPWLRFVITTRPQTSKSSLHSITKIEIDPSDSRNSDDLKAFFTFELCKRYPACDAQNLVDKLLEISEGLFLVAFYVLKMLDERATKSPSEVLKCFPCGISSVYEYYFSRILNCITPFIHVSPSESEDESGFFKMLEAVVGAEAPIPIEMFYDILCLESGEKVQRSKRTERNDAVQMLHTLFPVENDHVTVFHKSISDWLTLAGEDTHRFSVSVSRGREILSRKSWNVLRRFSESERDLNQPLVLSNIETFALRFGFHYVCESSVLSEAEKDQIALDVNILSAILSDYHDFQLKIEETSRFSTFTNLLINTGHYVTHLYENPKPFKQSVYYNNKPSFGQCLVFVVDYFPNFLRKLTGFRKRQLYGLPHCIVEPVVLDLPFVIQSKRQSSFLELFQTTNGFIAINVFPDDENPTTAVQVIKGDGSCSKTKTFVNSKVWCVSPDLRFLIVTETKSNKIKLFGVLSLKEVRVYECPRNNVTSCHVFGDNQQWYIVVKAADDSKIHILDGINGQLHYSIEVNSSEEIQGVSQSGHIVMSLIESISSSSSPPSHLPFNDDDDEKVIYWHSRDEMNKVTKVTYCKISTFHYKQQDVKIYFHPPKKVFDNLIFREFREMYESPVKKFKFSNDAKYFAYYYKLSILIFNTDDGTMEKRVPLNLNLICKEIVFLSSSGLVVIVVNSAYTVKIESLMFFDLTKSKLVYCVPLHKPCKLLSPWQHTDNLPRVLYGINCDGLFKFDFKNV